MRAQPGVGFELHAANACLTGVEEPRRTEGESWSRPDMHIFIVRPECSPVQTQTMVQKLGLEADLIGISFLGIKLWWFGRINRRASADRDEYRDSQARGPAAAFITLREGSVSQHVRTESVLQSGPHGG